MKSSLVIVGVLALLTFAIVGVAASRGGGTGQCAGQCQCGDQQMRLHVFGTVASVDMPNGRLTAFTLRTPRQGVVTITVTPETRYWVHGQKAMTGTVGVGDRVGVMLKGEIADGRGMALAVGTGGMMMRKHHHGVMGTVKSVAMDDKGTLTSLKLETCKGAEVTILVTDQTKYFAGKGKGEGNRGDVKVGDRIGVMLAGKVENGQGTAKAIGIHGPCACPMQKK
jgi:hypothetical protein